MDRTLRALITDLKDHGLPDKTLILTTGEFGCNSKINKNAGRDHRPRVMSMVVAGEGMQHSRAIGSTDLQGCDNDNRRVAPGAFAATVFHHCGIAQNTTRLYPQGRPRPVLTGERKVITELVG